MNTNRAWLIFSLLAALLLLSALLNLTMGSVAIPVVEIWNMIWGAEPATNSWHTIIWELRIPKMITAAMAGSGLAVSGLLMQTLFRNPLAGPFVLGISTGASLGVALLILAAEVLGIIWIGSWGAWSTVLAAISGSALVMLLMVSASFFIDDSMTLLIIGLMLGSLSGAIVSILQYFSQAQEIQSYLLWTFGNLGGVYGTKLWIMVSVTMLGLLCTLVLIKPLNGLLLGEAYATSLGVSVKRLRLSILGVTALLAGAITAFCGPLAFVGIAVPHLCRVLFKASNHQVLFPACVLMGAVVMLMCDTVAQIPGSAQTLPINAITSLIGAPVVILILLRNRKLGKSFAR